MYYLALFIDYRPFLIEKINEFLKKTSSNIFICNNQEESLLTSLEYIPSHQGFCYSQPWYIHGDRIAQEKFHLPPLLPPWKGGKLK